MTANTTKLMDLRPGEGVAIGGQARVEVIHKTGRVIRLRVVAPASVQVTKTASESLLDRETRHLQSPYPA